MHPRAYGYDGLHFAAYFWFVSWWRISLGVTVDLRAPNIEVHVPFGFFKFGRVKPYYIGDPRAGLVEMRARKALKAGQLVTLDEDVEALVPPDFTKPGNRKLRIVGKREPG